MVADRHPLVVRQQRIVGPEQLAGIGGVIDAREEVGVVADHGWQLEAAVGGAVEKPRSQTLDPSAVRPGGVEQIADAATKRDACLATEREQRVQRRA